MSTISIILPNHNHARELETSLDAAVNQTVAADEILLIDDASTDASLEVVQRFAEAHGNVRVLRNSSRLGVAATVSRGIQEATGQYILLASADERIRPHMVERLSQAAERFPEAKLIVSSFTEWWPEHDEIRVHDRHSDRGIWYLPSEEPAFVTPEALHGLLREWFVWLSANSGLIARAALLEVQGFDPALEWHSDWFAMYAIAFRYGFCAVPESLALFRVSSESYSARGMRSPEATRRVAMAIQRKLRDPAYADFRAAVARSPAVLSTFMRPTMQALAVRPADYGMLLAILRWWLVQVGKGRRPGFWARWLHGGELPGPE